jgi:DNA polymerase IV (DinB-like DNA polymerase)
MRFLGGSDPKEGSGRGVGSTYSYETGKYGILSAMPISQAYSLIISFFDLPFYD